MKRYDTSLRKKHGISGTKLGKAFGMSQRWISSVECGTTVLSQEDHHRLAMTLEKLIEQKMMVEAYAREIGYPMPLCA